MEPFELYVLDDSFNTVYIVDAYESMIWTDRYRECGDFELYLSASSDALVYVEPNFYIWTKNSDRLMIVETIEITTDTEDGNHLKITGRSLESILDRRIVWNKVTLSGKVQDVVKRLITDAIIEPTLEARRIDNFIFIDNPSETLAEFEVEEKQYLGENLYETIIDVLAVYNIGLKIIYNFETGNFECSLYLGEDRSYEQDINPYVIFSPEFDNLVSSDYIESIENYKSVNLICGEDPDSSSGRTKKYVYVDDGSGNTEGLFRREMYTDGSSTNQDYTDENEQEVHLTDEQYVAALKTAAIEELNKTENRIAKSFEGEMSSLRSFTYGKDYYLGDVVQVENEYGFSNTAKITEMILSQSTSGIDMYPTFECTK